MTHFPQIDLRERVDRVSWVTPARLVACLEMINIPQVEIDRVVMGLHSREVVERTIEVCWCREADVSMDVSQRSFTLGKGLQGW